MLSLVILSRFFIWVIVILVLSAFHIIFIFYFVSALFQFKVNRFFKVLVNNNSICHFCSLSLSLYGRVQLGDYVEFLLLCFIEERDIEFDERICFFIDLFIGELYLLHKIKVLFHFLVVTRITTRWGVCNAKTLSLCHALKNVLLHLRQWQLNS